MNQFPRVVAVCVAVWLACLAPLGEAPAALLYNPTGDGGENQWTGPGSSNWTRVDEWDGGYTTDCVYTSSTTWVLDQYSCGSATDTDEDTGWGEMRVSIGGQVVGWHDNASLVVKYRRAYWNVDHWALLDWTTAINVTVPYGGTPPDYFVRNSGWFDIGTTQQLHYSIRRLAIEGKRNGQCGALRVDEVGVCSD